MSESIRSAPAGSAWSWPLQIQDGDGDGVDCTGAAISATCWRGDDTAELFAPSAAWDDEAEGTFTLSDDGSGTATLAPGRYPVQVVVTPSGGDAVRHDVGYLEVTASPGSRLTGLTYATWDDMLSVGGDVLANLKGRSDQSLGQEALEEARRWTHRTALGRARGLLYDRAVGHAVPDSFAGLIDASDDDWTAASGSDLSDEVETRLRTVRAHLEAGYLMTGGRSVTGTAQAGAAGSITLAAGSSSTDDYYAGWTIRTTGGTGSGQRRWIADYDGTTLVATVSPAWDTAPDETTTYRLESGGDDDAAIRRANALWACFEVFRRQVGEAAEGTPFMKLAGHFRLEAIRMLEATPLRIDSDGDGRADYALG